MSLEWVGAMATTALIAAYEPLALVIRRWRPGRHSSRTLNAMLRDEWLGAVSAQPGSEILAVQTLRNSMMSATMLASTAALALMGTLGLALPGLRGAALAFTPAVLLELLLVSALIATLFCGVMSVRLYGHASFIVGLPVDGQARRRWTSAGRSYVHRAGVFYSMGLRHLILVAPPMAGLLRPEAGVVLGLAVVAALLTGERGAAA